MQNLVQAGFKLGGLNPKLKIKARTISEKN